jgi:hypothetical protein
MHGDAVIACADLIGRTGATGFELGYLHDGVPVEEAGWYAHANYRGTRIMTDEHRSPSAAALALAERLLAGGMCRCGQPVTLDDDRPGCRWQLMGKRWEPGCDAEPIQGRWASLPPWTLLLASLTPVGSVGGSLAGLFRHPQLPQPAAGASHLPVGAGHVVRPHGPRLILAGREGIPPLMPRAVVIVCRHVTRHPNCLATAG